jgi:predicted DNA-binding transcriptional regulator AlpA
MLLVAMQIRASAFLLTETDLSKQLNVSLAALRRWRTEKRGPRYRKLGALVRYDPADVAEWVRSCPTGGDAVQNSEPIGDGDSRCQ